MRGLTPEQLFPPDVAAAVSRGYQSCIEADKPISYEECLPFQGENSWWMTTLTPLRDASGRIYRIVGTSINNTLAKQVQEALRASVTRNRAFLEAIPDLMFRISFDGIFLDCKASREGDLALAKSEFLGKRVDEVLPPEIAEQTRCYTKLVLSTGQLQSFEYEFRQHGALRHYECRIAASGEEEILAIVRDISERKLALEALRLSEERFPSLVANIPGAVYRCQCDKDWTMEYLSDAVQAITGYPPDEFIDNRVRTFASIIHPEDRAMVDQVVLKAVEKKRPYTIE